MSQRLKCSHIFLVTSRIEYKNGKSLTWGGLLPVWDSHFNDEARQSRRVRKQRITSVRTDLKKAHLNQLKPAKTNWRSLRFSCENFVFERNKTKNTQTKEKIIYSILIISSWRCLWSNSYCRWKWTWRNRVLILAKAIWISHTVEKGINLIILPPAMDK